MKTFRFRDEEVIAIDTETTGLQWPRDQMFSFSVATLRTEHYVDIRYEEGIRWLKDELSRYHGLVVFHNASFDIKMFHSQGVDFDLRRVRDTSIEACLIDENLPNYSLDFLAKKYLGESKQSEIYDELAKLFGGRATKNVQMARVVQAPREVVAPYANKDTRLTLDLWVKFQGIIAEQDLQDVVSFEYSVMPSVIRSEMRGVRVDVAQAEQSLEMMHARVEQHKSKLRKQVGYELNVNSSPQIKKYFDPKEKEDGSWWIGDKVRCNTTAKGNPSIDAEVLLELAQHDPVAQTIIEIRKDIRLGDTFLAKHVIGSSIDGRVYPSINQVAGEDGGTRTGRFSYSGPALQQIPNRDKSSAAIVKPCFLPEEGHIWLDADLNSFEVRIFAHLVALYNNAIAEIYKKDPTTDFHQWVADLMGVPRNKPPEGGANAKQLNLSMIFNSGNGSIAQALGYPVTEESFVDRSGRRVVYWKAGPEAMRVINTYHSRVQGVKKLAERAKQIAEARGYIKTFKGRHLRFPRGYKSYKASGLLIQATSAEVNKTNWPGIESAIGDRGHMLLNTHDSYSMSVEEDKVRDVWRDVKESVESIDLRVPILLDLNGAGINWWDALQGDNTWNYV